MRERDIHKVELQRKRWSRKEEADFYRTLMAYGIEISTTSDKKYSWTRFRQLSRIDKIDEVLTEYYQAFSSMCKRVLGQPLSDEEGNYSNNLNTGHVRF